MKENDVNLILESLKKNCGLASLVPRGDSAGKFSSLTHDQLKKMSQSDCAEASYLISQESAIIRLETNRFKAIKGWAERQLKYIAAPAINNYGTQYTPYEYRLQMFIRENPQAQKLQTIISQMSLFVDQLEDITMYLRGIAKSLEALVYIRRDQ